MDVTDAAVRGMVRALKPGWHVESVDRSPYGTDFVATLDVQTPSRARTVVLKATTADFVAPTIARSEPRLLELIKEETSIPVPSVFGYCDEHDDYPVPFYLMSYVTGENYEGRAGTLPPRMPERILREAGRNLAELHELGPLDSYGRIGVQNGMLAVMDTNEFPRYDDFRDKLLVDCEDTLDSLTSGGFFPELADDPDWFTDLVPAVRSYVEEAIPALPAPQPPTYNHWDYRYGNLLIDPKTGETQAVLDWANLSAADPAYNIAKAEFHLLKPVRESDERTATLKDIFRTAYTDARDDWTFDSATRERMRMYKLTNRLDAMACLPLWYQDSTPEERNRRASEHRDFVSQYV